MYAFKVTNSEFHKQLNSNIQCKHTCNFNIFNITFVNDVCNVNNVIYMKIVAILFKSSRAVPFETYPAIMDSKHNNGSTLP